MNRSAFFFRISSLALVLASGGCTLTQVSLDYQPHPSHVLQGAPQFVTGRFVNMTGQGPFELGTVRTPIGTPIEYVHTRSPLEEVVRNAFSHALQTRGMLTTQGKARYTLTGEILELFCQVVVHPYGYAKLRVNVVDTHTGQIIFTRIYSGERQNPAYRPGSGSPVPALRDLASRALQDAVDRTIDDPELRARLSSGSRQTGMY